ncbi:hypothetical protein J23TS9_44620 [Paenibacillus sp. J23TS9]|uniref:DUF4184 family protein n=1 Tax=Paenibacillus sp. J23TS9 TaxID=2807193 RepID=UPI001B1AF5EE|nr:DUF4184 family protein [Paenibacillus sp. J23TS9]GIP29332.1 hypothetical protein J23TS9_44620 [Paenibacillus sp. J23TS9]
MPFTFAHPIYIIPAKFMKPGYISITGLILGSMAPDFEYFIALEPYQWIGHTHKGLLLQAIPICTVILLLLQLIMKPFALHLPSMFNLDVRTSGLINAFDYRRLKSWVVFLVSVVIGFYSHVFIDAFTHKSGYFVLRFPALQSMYFGLPAFKLLQYSLSVCGILAELLIILFLLNRATCSTTALKRISMNRKMRYWTGVIVTAMATTLGKLLFTASTNLPGVLVVSPISGLILGIIMMGLLFRKV